MGKCLKLKLRGMTMDKKDDEVYSNSYYLFKLRRMGFDKSDEELMNLALRYALQSVENEMGNGYYHINQSPFFKKSHHDKYVRDSAMEKVSFRMPKTAYKDLMTYFKGNGWNLTDGMNKILTDKLEMINTSKRTIFNNTEVIMLIPRTSNISELNSFSKIIGLFNPDIDFHSSYVYKGGFKKSFNIRYRLNHFLEGIFPLEEFSMMNESRLFGIRLGEMTDWDLFYERMSELYSDLDLDKCYFVKFPLNNYLDVNRQGQFQHHQYMGKHQGLYAFDDMGYHGTYMALDWKYDSSGLINLKFKFLPRDEFHHILRTSDFSPLNNALDDLLDSKFHIKELDESIQATERQLEFLKNLRDKI